MTGVFFFLVFLGVVYYGMYAATAGVLWSVRERREGGCHHDNGVAKGAGTTSGKGKECACNEPGACMSSGGSVRACVRARGGGGWGQAEYYGLSVAR